MSKKPKKPALNPNLILGTIPLEAERAKAVKSGRAKKDDRKASEQKFGKPVIEIGFTVIPSLLLQAQERLGLSPIQLNIILQLMDFWWKPGDKPYPSQKRIADRMQVSTRTVQRHLRELETAGLINRIARMKADGGRTTSEYDMKGLVGQLQLLEPEFTKIAKDRQAIQKKKRQTERPSQRRKKKRA